MNLRFSIVTERSENVGYSIVSSRADFGSDEMRALFTKCRLVAI